MAQDMLEQEISDPAADAQPVDGASSTPESRSWKRFVRPALALIVAVGVSLAVFLVSDRVESFGRYGYPGIFVLSLLANATIIIPAPSLAVVTIMGSVLNPFAVGACAGAGEALGELTGYLAGYSGRTVIENQARYEQLARWTHRYGLRVIFVLSVIPNPLFDLAGIAAGALKIPVRRFLMVCWVGKTIKTTLFALGGQGVAALLPFLNR